MKADLHVHSEYSWDSKVSIKTYIELAEDLGIDIISITDHNDIRSHEEIRELQKSTKVLLVPGQEINTANGHLLVYGWIPLIKRDLPMSETVELIHKMAMEHKCQVISVAAHPFDFLRSGGGQVVLQSGIDGLEVLNASSLFTYFNKKAYKKSRGLNLAKLGNSDSHRREEFATAFNEIPYCETVEDVLNNILKVRAMGNRIGIRRKLIRFSRRKLGLMTD